MESIALLSNSRDNGFTGVNLYCDDEARPPLLQAPTNDHAPGVLFAAVLGHHEYRQLPHICISTCLTIQTISALCRPPSWMRHQIPEPMRSHSAVESRCRCVHLGAMTLLNLQPLLPPTAVHIHGIPFEHCCNTEELFSCLRKGP